MQAGTGSGPIPRLVPRLDSIKLKPARFTWNRRIPRDIGSVLRQSFSSMSKVLGPDFTENFRPDEPGVR
jgi:hypothetical protein